MSAAGAGAAVHNDDRVADLAAGEVAAGIDLVVDDDAAAEAGAQRDGDRVVGACERAGLVLAVSRSVGVVLKDDELAVRAVGDHLAQLEVLEVQVVGELDDAGRAVDGAGASDADPRHVVEREVALPSASWQTSTILSQKTSSEQGTGVFWDAFAIIALFSSTTPTAMLVPPTSTPR